MNAAKKIGIVSVFSLFFLAACGGGNPVKEYNETVENALNKVSASFTTMLQEFTLEMLKEPADYGKIVAAVDKGVGQVTAELAPMKQIMAPKGEGVKEVQDALNNFIQIHEEIASAFYEVKLAAQAKSEEKLAEANLKLLPLLGKVDEVGGALIEAQKNMLIKNNLAAEADFKE